MNKKCILMLMLAPSIALTGCGGGGDSGGNLEAGSTIVNGTRYYSIEYAQGSYSDGFAGSFIEVNNGKITDNSTNKQLGEYILTSSKLYKPTDIATNTIQINTPTNWTMNLIGDVKKELKLEQVNLAGVNIFDTLLPGARTEGFDTNQSYSNARIFLLNEGTVKFPQGSQCLRLVSHKSSQDSFSFDATSDDIIKYSDGSTYNFEDYDADNQVYVNNLNQYNPFGFSYRYTSGTWQGIPWTTIYQIDTGLNANNSTAVKYQNQNYRADFDSAVEWKVKNEINQYETILSKSTSLSSDDQKVFRRYIAQLKTGCYLYNDTASRAIQNLSSVRWIN